MPHAHPAAPPAAHRVAAVSYLNSKPLLHGLDAEDLAQRLSLHLDVPARLLSLLEAGQVDLALCPVVDYFRSRVPLTLVPVGGIACEGPTLTVRLYSRVPLGDITAVHADTDSHTSVALLRVLLHELHGLSPEFIHFDAQHRLVEGRPLDPAHPPQAMLLIGDKVVTASPSATVYPHQLDLGGAWNELTGKPFVFAVWMAREGADLGDLPSLLAERRDRNLTDTAAIAAHYAAGHGWPLDLAADYLGGILRYRLGERELDAIADFARRAAALHLIPEPAREPSVYAPLPM